MISTTIANLLFIASLNEGCPDIAIKPPAGEWVTVEDRREAHRAERQCMVRYNNSPCLKKLQRYGANDYTVVCGPPGSISWQPGDGE